MLRRLASWQRGSGGVGGGGGERERNPKYMQVHGDLTDRHFLLIRALVTELSLSVFLFILFRLTGQYLLVTEVCFTSLKA